MDKHLLTQVLRFATPQVGAGTPLPTPVTIKGPAGFDINNLGELTNRIMIFLVPFSGLLLLLILIWGGYDYLMSRGAPERIKSARAKMTAAIIGFVLLVSAYIIVRFIAFILNLNTTGLF